MSSYEVAMVAGARDPRVTVREMDATAFQALLSEPVMVRSGKLDAPGWMPVVMRPGATHRRTESVAAVWALVVDLDHGAEWDDVVGAIRGAGYRAHAHTTWSHTPERHRLRVVLPFEAQCPAFQWRKVWGAGARWAASWGAEVDGACKDPARLYFLPAVGSERARQAFRAVTVDGPLLSWRRLALDWPAPPEPERPSGPSLRTRIGWSATALDRVAERRARYVEAVVRAAADRVASAVEGQRNATLNREAYTLGRFVGARVLPEADARRIMEGAGRAAGLDARETQRTTDSGLTAGMEVPWTWRS